MKVRHTRYDPATYAIIVEMVDYEPEFDERGIIVFCPTCGSNDELCEVVQVIEWQPTLGVHLTPNGLGVDDYMSADRGDGGDHLGWACRSCCSEFTDDELVNAMKVATVVCELDRRRDRAIDRGEVLS